MTRERALVALQELGIDPATVVIPTTKVQKWLNNQKRRVQLQKQESRIKAREPKSLLEQFSS